MLRRERAATIPATLTVNGQGGSVTFNITYHNRKQSEVAEKTLAATKNNEEGGITALLLFLVESWECDYALTNEGVREMEDDWPGLILAIVQGFHDARQMTRAKN